MACVDGEADSWIDRLKFGGVVPLLEPENCSNGWAIPHGDKFMVRGPDYFQNKVKIPGGEFLLKPLGFDWIKGPKKIGEVLKHPQHRVRKAIDEAISSGGYHFVLAINLQLPSKDNFSAIAYFVATEPIPDGSLFDLFVKGDDAHRNSRLKLIANVVNGPWIVKAAVGEQAICILGRTISCKYFHGPSFIEVDVDIGASVVANAIVHLAFGYIRTLTVDLAFLIESQSELELPEKILGAVRFSELNPDSASLYELPSEENSSDLQSSLTTRLWKSIGQGFTQLLHHGNQDLSVCTSENTNGNLHNTDGETCVDK